MYTSRLGFAVHSYFLKESKRNENFKKQKQIGALTETNPIFALPFLSDNYCYVVLYANRNSETCAIIFDAGDPEVVLHFLANNPNVTLTHVFSTHKHWDHSAGNEKLAKGSALVSVIGSSVDKVSACTKQVTPKGMFATWSNL
jgi:hydroxyacylglutathione hydrolase